MEFWAEFVVGVNFWTEFWTSIMKSRFFFGQFLGSYFQMVMVSVPVLARISLFPSFNRAGVRICAGNWSETGAPSPPPVPSSPRLSVSFFEKLNLNAFQDGYDIFSPLYCA